LFAVLAHLILTVVDMMTETYNVQSSSGLLSGVFGLAVLIPSFALNARRLHDINKSGWWQLSILLIVPVLVLIVWGIKRSDKRTNKHGPDPRQATSQ
jgi:uncharacterized membrane protein YhaH (DUF805 family)